MTNRTRARLGRPLVKTDPQWVSDAYRALFSTPEGVLVLDHIVQELCGVDKPLFHPADAGLAYNVARRDVGLQIWRLASGQRDLANPEVKTENAR